MANTTTATCLPLFPSLEMAWRDVDSSFERFCLTAGIGAVEQMLRQDAQQLTGAPHSRGGGRAGHRWGTTEGKIRLPRRQSYGPASASGRQQAEAALSFLPGFCHRLPFAHRTALRRQAVLERAVVGGNEWDRV